jgi:hypothetical protein
MSFRLLTRAHADQIVTVGVVQRLVRPRGLAHARAELGF